MKMRAVTVVPAGSGFPTSHCSVRLLAAVGGEHSTEIWCDGETIYILFDHSGL